MSSTTGFGADKKAMWSITDARKAAEAFYLAKPEENSNPTSAAVSAEQEALVIEAIAAEPEISRRDLLEMFVGSGKMTERELDSTLAKHAIAGVTMQAGGKCATYRLRPRRR